MKYSLRDERIKYVLLLTNDTEIAPYCLHELIRTAESYESSGVFQPKLLSMSDPSQIDAIGISINRRDGEAAQCGYGKMMGI